MNDFNFDKFSLPMHQWIWINVGSGGFILNTFLPIRNSSEISVLLVIRTSVHLDFRPSRPLAFRLLAIWPSRLLAFRLVAIWTYGLCISSLWTSRLWNSSLWTSWHLLASIKCPGQDIFGLPCRLHQSQIPNILPAHTPRSSIV